VSRTRRWLLGGIAALAVLGITWAIVAAIMPAWYARLWYPLNNVAALQAAARREEIDPALLAAVIQEESKWDPGAVSHAGAVGLMQLEPATARFIATQKHPPPGDPTNLGNSDVSIAYGAWYLHYLINRTGSVPAALVAYNAGEHNLDRWRAAAAAGGRTFEIPKDVPYPETRAFINNVLGDMKIYRRAYPDQLPVPAAHRSAVSTTPQGGAARRTRSG
jgi:soluble lytic murein transglycosylase